MTSPSSTSYVDTPYGIMTTGGRWYHVTEEALQEYAGNVLDHVSLEQLLTWADRWVDSAQTVALWLLPVLLWWLPLGWALGAWIGIYVTWALGSPALPSLIAVRTLDVLDHVIVQAVYYVLAMTALAFSGQDAAVGVGLLVFVLIRWGIVGWAFGYLLPPLRQRLYPLPVADQILRGLIVRVALKYRLSLPQVNEITEDIIDKWTRHRNDEP